MTGKIKSLPALARIVAGLKKRGRRIVFTNGCFDILHVGHVDYLRRARKMGDVLIIGLNSDSSVRRLKGASRPINKERDRATIISALWFVDYVTIFNEDTPEALVRKIKPDIMVKGSDWKGKCVAGADFVKSRGGRVRMVPLVKGHSTTSTIKKLKHSLNV
ncbi:MAG: D-glycero-beta-D-manno-heptose 1-phosphate adenylyltransferase [Candidatus Omnitrophota bacterium]|nr:D-glycero-beta-D-manno-heptose 1-phosphate adenylyltransferase [Candidatus Omnitrophota bacterium]